MKRSRLKRVGRRGLTLAMLDAWLRKVVIARDKTCVAEGAWGMQCGGPLQGAHLLPKGSNPGLRYDLLNVVAMCRNHHMFGFHCRDPLAVSEWMRQRFSDSWLEHLRRLSLERKGQKLDKEAVLLFLKAELKRMETA